MAVLDQKIQSIIDEITDESYEYYSKGEKQKSYDLMEKAWKTYPEPKENWNESFNTARYALDDLLKDNKLERAKIWFERLTKIQNNLKLWDGMYDFCKGRYYFEMGNLDEARKGFKECIKIGRGNRYFENEDPKYLEFIKNK